MAKKPNPRPNHNQNVSPRFVVVLGPYGFDNRTIVDTVDGIEICEFKSRQGSKGADAAYYARLIATALNERY
jgi:hypothetical protein